MDKSSLPYPYRTQRKVTAQIRDCFTSRIFYYIHSYCATHIKNECRASLY